MSATASDEPTWILVRNASLSEDERAVVAELGRRATALGRRPVTVLLGSAAAEAELAPAGGDRARSALWVLEDDARGRGLRLAPDGPVRVVSREEFVASLMSAEKVVQLP